MIEPKNTFTETPDEGYINTSDLLGEVFTKFLIGTEELIFYTEDGQKIRMFHDQDCCEHVEINDICGDLYDLIGSPITSADEVSHNDPNGVESATWTFYKLGTKNGSVTIRWYGTSNGYYSESVSLYVEWKNK